MGFYMGIMHTYTVDTKIALRISSERSVLEALSYRDTLNVIEEHVLQLDALMVHIQYASER
jgi:hypothetical protein